MRFHSYNIAKHCRWCGKPYMAVKPVGKDGFHLPRCKQAHYRAYKKYVTASPQRNPRLRRHPVTQKKKKKR